MEMCYDGALVMPSNYAVMNEDEMTYVEGGATRRSVNWIAYPIDFVSTLVGLNMSAIMGCAGGAIAKMAVKKWAVLATHKYIQRLIGGAGVTALTGAINWLSKNNTVVSLLTRCTSWGGIIGVIVDMNDGVINGYFNSPI